MANHTVAVTLNGSLAPILRRSGLFFFGALALGAALRFFDRGSDQASALLWLAIASVGGGALWNLVSHERDGGR